MIIGFTGTREGLTNQQLGWLVTLLEEQAAAARNGVVTQIHHGACEGADLAVHKACLDMEIPVHVWPPTNPKHTAPQCLQPHPLVTVHHFMPYLVRDREIVRTTAGLIVLPKHDAKPDRMAWGGTWYTEDFAERMNKPVIICYPKGVVQQIYPEGNVNG
jgi:hypothetical protein